MIKLKGVFTKFSPYTYPGRDYGKYEWDWNINKWVISKEFFKNNETMKSEFKIICISMSTGIGPGNIVISRGEIFKTNNYEFNYGEEYARLFSNGKILGIFKKSDFKTLQEYRSDKLKSILNE